MLLIRNDQLEVFQGNAQKAFDESMLAHLRRRFPADFARIGESQVRRVISEGMVRAAKHAIVTRNDIREFIYLMVVLGSGFADDPQLPWAGEVLGDTAIPPSERVGVLQARAADYVEQVAGQGGTGYVKALCRARDLAFAEYAHAEAPALLQRLWPRKLETLTPAAVAASLALADANRDRYGLDSPSGAALYVALMFMLGSDFDRDPLYPWAEPILLDDAPAGLKAARLHAEAMSQIDAALALLRARRED
jgi:hypothetical protein